MTTYLRWDAPTTGPKPDGYEVYADGFFYARTDKTEIAIPGRDAETEYVVFSYRVVAHPEGNKFIRSKPVSLTIGHRITDIEITPEGVILTFPTKVGSTYSVERADTPAGPWVEVMRFVADAPVSSRGGDPLLEHAVYRAWRVS